jgi:hypothetical protein
MTTQPTARLCTFCREQSFDPMHNDRDTCMACQALQRLAEGAHSLENLPLHHVVEEGVNVIGQRYVRLRYIDGSEDLIDPVPWDETVAEPDEIGGSWSTTDP